MGKYLNAATISGIYQNLNPARRTVNGLTRNWSDANGNRVVDCDLMSFAPNGECTTFSFIAGDFARFGKDPLSLDAAGNAVGLNTIPCGRTEKGINPALQAYCNQYGDSLLEGWGRRRSEWQFGLGIQHELLPRLSAELTYNRRSDSYNATYTRDNPATAQNENQWGCRCLSCRHGSSARRCNSTSSEAPPQTVEKNHVDLAPPRGGYSPRGASSRARLKSP